MRSFTQITWSLPGHLNQLRYVPSESGHIHLSIAYAQSPSRYGMIPRPCVVINHQYCDKPYLLFDTDILVCFLRCPKTNRVIEMGSHRCAVPLDTKGHLKRFFRDQNMTIRRKSSSLTWRIDMLLFSGPAI